jgi:hypothetical protein
VLFRFRAAKVALIDDNLRRSIAAMQRLTVFPVKNDKNGLFREV